MKKFLGSILLFTLSVLLSVFNISLADGLFNLSGVASGVSLIALIPLLVIFYGLQVATIISGAIFTIGHFKDDNKAIMISSIVLFCLFVGSLILNVVYAIRVFGIL